MSGDPAKETEATTEQDIRERLDRGLPKLMEKHEVSGVAIAVRLADGHVFDYPAGKDANGTEVTDKTWFRVASITKLMTALTVLRLVEKEKLRLDQTLDELLGKHQASEHGVRIRDLLAHVGGLPFTWKGKDSPLEVATVKPGTDFQYSNAGYDVLGLVIEKATGQLFGDVAKREVAGPLEVVATLGELPNNVHVAALYGREVKHLNWTSLPRLEWPSGGLVMTAQNVLGLIGGFAYPPADFLPEKLLGEARADATGGVDHPTYPTDPSAAWGLGPEVRGLKERCFCGTHAGRDSFGHYGGSGCLVWHDPDTQLTWSILNTKTVGAARREEREDWAFDFWGDISDKVVPLTKEKIHALSSGGR